MMNWKTLLCETRIREMVLHVFGCGCHQDRKFGYASERFVEVCSEAQDFQVVQEVSVGGDDVVAEDICFLGLGLAGLVELLDEQS